MVYQRCREYLYYPGVCWLQPWLRPGLFEYLEVADYWEGFGVSSDGGDYAHYRYYEDYEA